MLYLKQSTASQSVVIGPFVDSTDGNTAETGLTIANTDIRLSKNGANIVAKNSGGGTHDEIGYYTITLDATDTDTVGRLQLMVHASGALPVYHEYQVLEEALYDGLFASGAARVPADATAISGDTTAADNLELAYDDTAGSVTHHGIVDQGTAQSATGTTLVLRAAAAFADDELIGATIVIVSATAGAGQARTITDYVSSTDTATVDTWTTTPTGTIVYKIFAGPPASASSPPAVNVTQFGGTNGTFSGGRPEVNTSHWAGSATATNDVALATAPANFADLAITASTGRVTVGTNADKTGYSLSASQTFDLTGDITGNLSGSVGSVTGAVGSVTGNVGGNVTGSVGSLGAQAKLDVNAECDTALADYDAPTKAELDTAVANVSVDEIQATALADLFNTDSATTYASAVAGSVVKEIADNAGGSALTEAGIADAVWNEAQADHTTAGSFGEVATEIAAILVDTGTTLDGKLDAVKAKTDSLTFTVASVLDANIQYVNDVQVNGTGASGDEWGP